jgi:hypothetical protein
MNGVTVVDSASGFLVIDRNNRTLAGGFGLMLLHGHGSIEILLTDELMRIATTGFALHSLI